MKRIILAACTWAAISIAPAAAQVSIEGGPHVLLGQRQSGNGSATAIGGALEIGLPWLAVGGELNRWTELPFCPSDEPEDCNLLIDGTVRLQLPRTLLPVQPFVAGGFGNTLRDGNTTSTSRRIGGGVRFPAIRGLVLQGEVRYLRLYAYRVVGVECPTPPAGCIPLVARRFTLDLGVLAIGGRWQVGF